MAVDRERGEKIDRDRKEEEAGREEKRMMKNKANARVAATGQRSLSLLLLQGLDGWRQRQRVS